MKNLSEELGIETLSIIKRGALSDIVKEDSELNAFFTKQRVEEGLEDCHLTIKSDLSKEEKIKVIVEMMNTWDEKGEPIYDL